MLLELCGLLLVSDPDPLPLAGDASLTLLLRIEKSIVLRALFGFFSSSFWSPFPRDRLKMPLCRFVAFVSSLVGGDPPPNEEMEMDFLCRPLPLVPKRFLFSLAGFPLETLSKNGGLGGARGSSGGANVSFLISRYGDCLLAGTVFVRTTDFLFARGVTNDLR